MDTFVEVIATSGVFAVLFVMLLFYQIKDNKVREEKYVATINSLVASLSLLQDVKETTAEIMKIVQAKCKNELKKSDIKEENE